jgi:hypothetical protein
MSIQRWRKPAMKWCRYAQTDAARKHGGELTVGDFRGQAGVKHPDDEGQQQEHQKTADAMKDRHDAGRRQAVTDDLADMDIAVLGPRFDDFGHLQLSR